NQLRRVSANALGVTCAPADVHANIAPVGPVRLRQRLSERQKAGLSRRIVRGCVHEHADAPHPLALLRARLERPRCRRAAEQRYELAPAHHSITSSARASSVGGTSRPSVLAVLRLMTRSNLVGCSTGMSPGFVPCKILSTTSAERRNRSGKLAAKLDLPLRPAPANRVSWGGARRKPRGWSPFGCWSWAAP